VRLPVLTLAALIAPAVYAQTDTIDQETHGSCSPAVADVDGSVSITCNGADVEALTSLLNKFAAILDQRLKEDPAPYSEILERLDEILTLQKVEQQQHARRTLNDEQKAALTRSLSAFRGTKCTLAASISDDEAVQYANDFRSALGAAGWDVNVALVPPFDHEGIRLAVNRDGHPQGASALVDVLKQLGIAAPVFDDTRVSHDRFRIDFGRK